MREPGIVREEAQPREGFGPRSAGDFWRTGLAWLDTARTARWGRWHDALGIAALIAVYYGAAHLGYAFNFVSPVGGIVWLPVGVGVAWLYIAGLRFWPGVLVGDLLVNNYGTLPLGVALATSVGNLLEVVLAVLLMRRLAGGGPPLASIKRVTGVFVALAVGTALSATVGLVASRLGDVVSSGAFLKLWRTWWLGDLCGALLVVPLALAWRRLPSRDWFRQRAAGGVLLLLAIVALGAIGTHTTRPVAYLTFPALILAAVRFGQRGATLAVAIAAAQAVRATTHYVGPFEFHQVSSDVIAAQLYIAVAALSTLSLAALVSERDEFEDRLLTSRMRLVKTADMERRRIERNLHDGAQQRLTALAVYLGIAADDAQLKPAQARALFARSERDLLVAIQELRELAHGMHPPLLRKQGLAKAIREVTRGSSVPVEFVELPPTRFDDAAEGTAYFVLVEAITNAQKHSHGSSIGVRARVSNGTLDVHVADDGIGGATEADGAGLQGLRDRVEAMGGRFAVWSPAGRGTQVTASIPATALER